MAGCAGVMSGQGCLEVAALNNAAYFYLAIIESR